jgi:16S rRNA processing protein RimM
VANMSVKNEGKLTYRSDELFTVGKIVNTHGLKGEVKVYPYTSAKEDFEEFDYLLVKSGKDSYERIEVEWNRYVKDMVLAKFEGYDHINDIMRLKDKEVFFPRSEYDDIEDGEYYVVDLIGLEVVDEARGRIGVLKDILQNRSQDLYVVKCDDGREVMIPAVDEFILDIDMDKKRMSVKLIEGLI